LYPSAPRYTVLSNATTKCLLSLNIILNPWQTTKNET
jgi:hypothetical protein